MYVADRGDGTYQNPVLYADYSDPDVIRVGDTYYMTASSFQYTPGLPILTSKDLVNWRLVNYAVQNLPFPGYEAPQHANGLWAPAIRWHDGWFWIFVGLPDEGIYMTRARDPLGEWSALHCVLPGRGLIDPCPFWDEDGRAYVVHAVARSRAGFNSVLSIFEMTPDGNRAVGEDRRVFDGTATQPTIEGPKLYKRDGRYYILAPAGGVTGGWQTALRGESIWGPYEEKIVMHQGDTAVNGPHQGGLVSDVTGGEWFLHFQDKGLAGRIPHLQPVRWIDGWPIMGEIGVDGIGQPVLVHAKPPCDAPQEITALAGSDDFTGPGLDLRWQWQANHDPSFYAFDEYGLRLFCRHIEGAQSFPLRLAPNVLTQKLVMPAFTATVEVDFSALEEGDCGGFALLGSAYHCLCAERTDCGTQLFFVSGDDQGDARQKICALEPGVAILSLRLEYNGVLGSFSYTLGKGQTFRPAGNAFAMSNDTWVGGKLGLFALSARPESQGSVGYRHLIVEPIK